MWAEFQAGMAFEVLESTVSKERTFEYENSSLHGLSSFNAGLASTCAFEQQSSEASFPTLVCHPQWMHLTMKTSSFHSFSSSELSSILTVPSARRQLSSNHTFPPDEKWSCSEIISKMREESLEWCLGCGSFFVIRISWLNWLGAFYSQIEGCLSQSFIALGDARLGWTSFLESNLAWGNFHSCVLLATNESVFPLALKSVNLGFHTSAMFVARSDYPLSSQLIHLSVLHRCYLQRRFTYNLPSSPQFLPL